MRIVKIGTALLSLGLCVPATAQVQQVAFRSWQALELKNEFVRLDVTPQLGGRILGYHLGDHSFLWANRKLEGQLPPPTRLAPDGSWLNWGGDKLWPAPQGWDNDQQWPGPPDPVLDGSPQEARELKGTGASAGIELTSPADEKTGIQFSRTIHIFPGSSRVNVAATMTNISQRPVQWGIWTVTQLDAGNANGEGWNPNWSTYIPFNQDSRFPRGYTLLHGSESNPEIEPIQGVMRLTYMWIVGKVGLDASEGWLANVDGSSGYLFVQKFHYVPDAPYPDGSSVEVWTNGVGTIHAWGKTVQISPDPQENPFIVESELLGPLVKLQPREHANFTYDWYSANIGGDFPVLSCGDFGCNCERLAAHRVQKSIRLDGRFGVFYKGHLEVELLNEDGRPVGTPVVFGAVSPLRPVVLDGFQIDAPDDVATVRIILQPDESGERVELGRTIVAH